MEGHKVILRCSDNCEDNLDPCYLVITIREDKNPKYITLLTKCIFDRDLNKKWEVQDGD